VGYDPGLAKENHGRKWEMAVLSSTGCSVGFSSCGGESMGRQPHASASETLDEPKESTWRGPEDEHCTDEQGEDGGSYTGENAPFRPGWPQLQEC
jgi:hypothetical protein